MHPEIACFCVCDVRVRACVHACLQSSASDTSAEHWSGAGRRESVIKIKTSRLLALKDSSIAAPSRSLESPLRSAAENLGDADFKNRFGEKIHKTVRKQPGEGSVSID